MSNLIPEQKQRDILICAFRYALGRRTYVSMELSELIQSSWHNLSKHDRELYQREIRDAIDQGMAGDKCDVDMWEQVLRMEA